MILTRHLNATQRLIDLGCKNIALFSSVDNLSVGKLRTDGYLQALKNNGIAVNETIILRTNSEEDLNAAILNIPAKEPIDAIFALEETDTVAALKYRTKTWL